MTTEPMALDGTWKADALDVIEHLARQGTPFTADALHDRLRPAPSPAIVGAVFRAACQRGLITCTGHTESTHPSRKGGIVRTWVGAPQVQPRLADVA